MIWRILFIIQIRALSMRQLNMWTTWRILVSKSAWAARVTHMIMRLLRASWRLWNMRRFIWKNTGRYMMLTSTLNILLKRFTIWNVFIHRSVINPSWFWEDVKFKYSTLTNCPLEGAQSSFLLKYCTWALKKLWLQFLQNSKTWQSKTPTSASPAPATDEAHLRRSGYGEIWY